MVMNDEWISAGEDMGGRGQLIFCFVIMCIRKIVNQAEHSHCKKISNYVQNFKVLERLG